MRYLFRDKYQFDLYTIKFEMSVNMKIVHFKWKIVF